MTFMSMDHAIEVKTSSLKDSERIRISSEYQLDAEDVDGMLFLYVNFCSSQFQQMVKNYQILSH